MKKFLLVFVLFSLLSVFISAESSSSDKKIMDTLTYYVPSLVDKVYVDVPLYTFGIVSKDKECLYDFETCYASPSEVLLRCSVTTASASKNYKSPLCHVTLIDKKRSLCTQEQCGPSQDVVRVTVDLKLSAEEALNSNKILVEVIAASVRGGGERSILLIFTQENLVLFNYGYPLSLGDNTMLVPYYTDDFYQRFFSYDPESGKVISESYSTSSKKLPRGVSYDGAFRPLEVPLEKTALSMCKEFYYHSLAKAFLGTTMRPVKIKAYHSFFKDDLGNIYLMKCNVDVSRFDSFISSLSSASLEEARNRGQEGVYISRTPIVTINTLYLKSPKPYYVIRRGQTITLPRTGAGEFSVTYSSFNIGANEVHMGINYNGRKLDCHFGLIDEMVLKLRYDYFLYKDGKDFVGIESELKLKGKQIPPSYTSQPYKKTVVDWGFIKRYDSLCESLEFRIDRVTPFEFRGHIFAK